MGGHHYRNGHDHNSDTGGTWDRNRLYTELDGYAKYERRPKMGFDHDYLDRSNQEFKSLDETSLGGHTVEWRK